MVERIDGFQSADDPVPAMAAVMQPPPDDSHKWFFTMVTVKNCQWCDKLRSDFANDPKLRTWVDTSDYTKSWGHWEVVQFEDESQAWRWKDFKPSSFPCLIVQPPANGSWGDPHTIVYSRQGYLPPAELDEAIRTAIQRYATKLYPKHLSFQAHASVDEPILVTEVGFTQSTGQGGWTPPVTPVSPLPPVPNYQPYPNLPQEFPPPQPQVQPTQPVQPVVPDLGDLLSQLIAGFFGGQGTGNLLLLAILAWQLYRGFAKQKGIPLFLDDATAAQLIQFLQQRQQTPQFPQQPIRPVSPS
jgi:hypothetical protein